MRRAPLRVGHQHRGARSESCSLWNLATRDAAGYLRERGLEVTPDLDVSFLDVQREGDWICWGGIDQDVLLDMYKADG
jgi:hypothetical protein